MGMRLKTINSISRGVFMSSDLSATGGQKYYWAELASGTHACSFPVGYDDEGLTLANFDAHTLVCGQTGSGKTLSILSSTILLCASSCDAPSLVVIDAKSTLFSLTARKLYDMGYTVRHISLFGEKSPDSFNPLRAVQDAIEEGHAVIADMLMDSLMESLQSSVRKDEDAFWQNTAANLISGCAYGLIEVLGKRAEPTLGMVSDLLAKGVSGISEFRGTISGKSALRLIDSALASAPAKETMAGVLGVAQTMLSPFTSASGRAITGKTTFNIEESLFGPNKTAIFVTCPDGSGAAVKQLASIFFNTLFILFSRRAETNAMEGIPERKVRVVFDEFSSFPRSMVPEMLAMSRSRGLCALISMQSTAQLMSAGYEQHESRAMLAQFGNMLLFRSTDSTINEVVRERTSGLVEPSNLAELEPGEALVSFIGKPVVRTSLPLFDDLLNKDIFPEQDNNTQSSVIPWINEPGSCVTLSSVAGTSEARDSVRYMFSRLAKAPSIPEDPDSTWANGFVALASRSNNYSDLFLRMKEFAQNKEPLFLSDVRLCGYTLGLKLNALAQESRAEAQLLCRKLGDGTFPIMPQLGDTLYLSALNILLSADESLAKQDTQALLEKLVGRLEGPCEDAVGKLEPWELEECLPIGWGLIEYQNKLKDYEEDDSGAWQKRVFHDALSSLGNTPHFALVRSLGRYKSIVQEGHRIGSLLFSNTKDSLELKLWVAIAGAFGPLFYPEACAQLRSVLMDSMVNPALVQER